MSRQIPHRVIYGQGAETLYHVPRDRHGRPTAVTSASYEIVDTREGEEATERTVVSSTSATVDAFVATTLAAAGRDQPNASVLTLSTVTGLAEGDRVLVTTAGTREMVTIDSIDGTTLQAYTRRPLTGTYASGATVQGLELSGDFPSSEANDADETVEDRGGMYQIIWVYTIDGEVFRVAEPIWVARYSLQPWTSEEEILALHPAIAKRYEPKTMADAIRYGTEETAVALEVVGKDPRQYRLGLAGRRGAAYGALAFIFDQFHGDNDERLATKYEEKHMRLVEKLTTGKTPYQTRGLSLSHDEPTEADTESSFFAEP